MKNIFASFVIIIGMVIICVLPQQFVFAQQSDYDKQLSAFAGEEGANFGEKKDPRELLSTVIATFLTILGTVFLAYSVYGGAIIMTSAGNSEKVEEGKATLRRGVIGVIIILSSYSIVYLVGKLVPIEKNYPDTVPINLPIELEEVEINEE